MIGNKFASRIAWCILCFYCSRPLIGQEAGRTSETTVVSLGIPTAGDTVFVDGVVQVPMRLEQPVSSASARKGDRVRLTLLKDVSADGKVVGAAGSTFYARVAHVRAKSGHREGEVRLSDAVPDAGSGLLLTEGDPREKWGPGAIPVVILGAVTLVPITVALLPIQLPYLLIHDIQEHRRGVWSHAPKPEYVDQELPKGSVMVYYADQKALMSRTAGH